MQAFAKAKVSCGDSGEIQVALLEALNNAVRHGSGLNPEKQIHVACRCDPKEGLWVMVRDEGEGFDPDRLPDPTNPENLERCGGRGVYMVRNLMDKVEYREGGREVHMWRRTRPSG
jgi:serine/threonine-protein kinase RsbW